MLEPHPVKLSPPVLGEVPSPVLGELPPPVPGQLPPPVSSELPKESADHPGEDEDEDDSDSSSGVSQVDRLLLEAQTYYISHHYAKATVVLKQAVAKGSARAALTLGSIYQKGGASEVPKDIALALQNYTHALELAMMSLDARAECGPDLLDAARSLTEVFQLGLVTHLSNAAERRASLTAMYAAEKHLRHKLPIPPLGSPLTDSENHRRAVVIALLFCRALTAHEVGNFEKAAQCYSKVVEMPPSTLGESAELQKKARLSINQLAERTNWKPSPKVAALVAASQPSPASPASPVSPASPASPASSTSRPVQPVQPNSETTTTTATTSAKATTAATAASATVGCASCGKQKPQMPMCSKCKVSRYCDMRCQRNHFEQHKQVCATLAEQASKERAARQSKLRGRRATWTSGSSKGNANVG